MKVCPNQGKPSAPRWTVLCGCGLGLLALALPATAWLDPTPHKSREGDSSFRPAQRRLSTDGAFSMAEAADRAGTLKSGSAAAAEAESTAGFQSSSKPFKPVTTPQQIFAPQLPFVSSPPASGAAFSGPVPRPAREATADAEVALDELEVTYQLALASFETGLPSGRGRAGVNPFQQALDSTGAPAPGVPSSGPAAPAGTPASSDSESAGSQGSGESTMPVDQPVPETPPDGGGFEEPLPLTYLVTGGPGAASVQRAGARDDGVFVLEDESELQLFGGATFGFARPSLLFGERDQMVAGDINGDGLVDIVQTRQQFLGAVVEVLIRSGNGFEFAASSVFRFDSIVAMALYDWDADGTRELALVTQGRANLLFYEIGENGLAYDREVTLRSKPAALIGATTSVGEQRLYLVPPELGNGRYLTAAAGTQQIPWRIRGQQSFQLEGDDAPEILTLGLHDRLVLLRRDGASLRMAGSLDRSRGTPLSLIGPHSGSDSWELMYLP